jgi:hypothetical protein
MCLTIAKLEHGVETASKDIKVYKLLRVRGGVAASPYQRLRYKSGDDKKVCYFTMGYERRCFNKDFPLNLSKNPISEYIHAGLHVYTNKREAASYCLSDRILVECTIPKGTKFIRGTDGEIVTLRLKVGRAIHGPANLVKAFNKKSSTRRSDECRGKVWIGG